MKYNSQEVLKDLDGEPLRDGLSLDGFIAQMNAQLDDESKRKFQQALDKIKRKELTLGRVCANALTSNFPDEQNLEGAEKMHRMQIALKVLKPKFRLTPTEKETIKKLVGKMYGPVVVGPVWALLEGTPLELPDEPEEAT